MKNYAIKEHHLYNKAFAKGQRAVGRLVAVYVLKDYAARRLRDANPQKQYLNRVGLSVGKKIGGAVHRAVRTAGVKTGFLVVLAAREEIRGKKAQDVEREMLKLFRRLDMIPGDAL